MGLSARPEVKAGDGKKRRKGRGGAGQEKPQLAEHIAREQALVLRRWVKKFGMGRGEAARLVFISENTLGRWERSVNGVGKAVNLFMGWSVREGGRRYSETSQEVLVMTNMERTEEETIVELAMERGLVSREQVDECMRICARGGREASLLEIVMKRGLLDEGETRILRELAVAGRREGDSRLKPAGQDSADSGSTGKTEKLPREFGRYTLLENIGQGSMGVVYKALDRSLGRYVALKMLVPGEKASERDIIRFHTEAKVAARLNHPNIVQVHDVGTEGGTHYITMDFVEGKTLDVLLTERKFSPRESLELILSVALAVHYAHKNGVIHRDVKPGNVIVDREGTPRIMDFGLAKDIGAPSRFTLTGAILGTPYYMSPEQASGRGDLDERTDVYSLGTLLYEMLTSRRPFESTSLVDLLKKVMDEEPSPLRKHNPTIARDIETICLMAMEKARERRYQSALELAEDMGRYLKGELIHAKRTGLGRRAMRALKKHRVVVGAAAMVVAVSAGIYSYFHHQSSIEKEKEKGRWQLVFEDAFDSGTLSSEWKRIGGAWTVESGEAVGQGSAALLLDYPIEGDVRVEFSVRVPDEVSSREWGCFMRGTVQNGFRSGYRFGVTRGEDARSYLERCGRPAFRRDSQGFEVGRVYQVVAEYCEGRIRLLVDGSEILSYEEYFPIGGEGRNKVGLIALNSNAHFDDVKVYTRTLPLKTDITRAGDELFEAGMYQRAYDFYSRIPASDIEEDDEARLSYKRALCLYQLGRWDDAVHLFEDVARRFPGTSVSEHARYQSAAALVRAGRVKAALEVVGDLLAIAKDSQVRDMATKFGISKAVECIERRECEYAVMLLQDFIDKTSMHERVFLVAWRLRGACYLMMEDYAGAENHAREMLDRLENWSEANEGIKNEYRFSAYEFLTTSYYLRGSMEEAISVTAEALGEEIAGPIERPARILRAHILCAAGRYEEALSEFEVGEDYYVMGMCHWFLGDIEKARNAWEKMQPRAPWGSFAWDEERTEIEKGMLLGTISPEDGKSRLKALRIDELVAIRHSIAVGIRYEMDGDFAMARKEYEGFKEDTLGNPLLLVVAHGLLNRLDRVAGEPPSSEEQEK